jgi:hypothetical protein
MPIAVSKPGIMGKAACCHRTTEVVITIFTAMRCARNSVSKVIGRDHVEHRPSEWQRLMLLYPQTSKIGTMRSRNPAGWAREASSATLYPVLVV